MKNIYNLFFCFFFGFSLFGQAPDISYASPNNFGINNPISPLFPANSGGGVPLQPMVTTLAGSGTIGAVNGIGANASFNYPTVVILDNQNNSIVMDRSNNIIRKIVADGTVSTLAGTGVMGSADGMGNLATFKYPAGAVVDSQDNIFVTDQGNHKIRKIAPDGLVTTFAGDGMAGFLDGTGIAARFYYPDGIAIDANDNLYVSDYSNNRIRKITPDGNVSTYAGVAASGALDGNVSIAQFSGPTGICVDNLGNVYVADYGNHKIRKINLLGEVSTVAGSGIPGAIDSNGSLASFTHPSGVCLDSAGNMYVADYGNHKIRKIDAAGNVTTFAGTGMVGATDDTVNNATFANPSGLCIGGAEIVYVSDYGNHKIRKIATYGYRVLPPLPDGLQLDPVTGEISGTPTQITTASNYTITATNEFGSSSFVVTIEIGTLGTAEFSQETATVYPNPVNHQLHISCKKAVKKIIVYNALGQLIQQYNEVLPVLDFSGLETGIYHLQIETEAELQRTTVTKQ